MKIVNAADAKYAPTPERPSRLHNAWQDMKPGTRLELPYDEQDSDRYLLSPEIGPLVVNVEHVEIRGDGAWGYGIQAANRDTHALVIEANYVTLRDLFIGRFFWREGEDFAANGPTLGKGSGIVFQNADPIGGLVLDNVRIEYQGLHGIVFAGKGDNGYQVCPSMRDVLVYGCGGDGINGRLVNAAQVHARTTKCGGAGLWLHESAGGRWHVTAESNQGAQQVALIHCDSIAARLWCEDFPKREGLLLESSTACTAGGRFGAWGAAVSVRFIGATGNTLEASQHYGTPAPQVVGQVSGNVIHPQVGADVRLNRSRNRVL